MALTDRINGLISKGRDISGTANALVDLPGVPESLRESVQNLFGTGRGLTPGQNRRDLNNFLATTSKLNGFTRPSYFYIEIAPPPIMAKQTENARTLAFLSESANLPGVALATSEVRRYGYGPTERKPYAPIFVDTNMTFFVDGAGMVQKFFYEWMNGIVKFDQTVNGKGSNVNGTVIQPFEVNYKSQYATDILITTVDEANHEIINCRLTKAFPVFMGDISLGWNDTDSIARLPITFTYYNWKIENINLNQVTENRAPGLVQSLLKASTAIQTLSTLRKPNNVADIVNVVNNTKLAIGRLF